MWFRAMIKYFKYFSLHPFKKSISKPSDLCFSPFKAQTSLHVLILTSLPAGTPLWMGDGWPTGLADLVTILTSFTISTASWGLKNKVFLAVKKGHQRQYTHLTSPHLVGKLLFEKNEGRIPIRTHFQLRATASAVLKLPTWRLSVLWILLYYSG